MNHADVIVLGTGGVGSAAAFHLARRGRRVIGLDRFPGGHDRGSSHGQTRIIRLAYFEHPDYVPLLRRAYELWADLERRQHQKLFFEVGLLEVGPANGVLIPGLQASARQHQLNLDEFAGQAFAERFPGFVLPEGHVALFERNAGYLLVEQCVLAHLAEAAKFGVDLRTGVAVQSWSADAGGVTVQTDRGTFTAERLVITAGPWAGPTLAELPLSLHVTRKHLHWYGSRSDVYRPERGGSTFLYETADGYFYGFPEMPGRGVKVGEHSGGSLVKDPLNDDRSVEPEDRARVEAFLASHMPAVERTAREHAVCYYTMSRDENFIVDVHPQHANVSFVAGLSGHGFKFTCVLGEILADLAIDGATRHPIGFLRSGRFGGR